MHQFSDKYRQVSVRTRIHIKKRPMPLKSITLLLSFCFCLFAATAQQKKFNYNAAWKKIDTMIERSGLIKSALTEVNSLYKRAKREKNDPQLVKSLLYRAMLNEQLSENAAVENIAMLEQEILASSGASRAILQSIAASAHLQYLQRNRWRFYDRTNTITFNKSDIATWTIDDLNQKITALFLASIQQKNLLQRTKLAAFDAVVIKGNARQLRPTLYDLLAHRALLFFMNDERYVTKPAYAFEIDGAESFAQPNEFASYPFSTRDTLSMHYHALKIFQELTVFHLKDRDPAALIDLSLHRVQFARAHSTHEEKEELYREALRRLISAYPGQTRTADVMYVLAEWHMERGRQYDPLRDTSYRLEITRAKQICESALAMKGDPEGKTNCANLLLEIERPAISLRTEKVNLPGLPFRSLVTYRNITTGYFRVIRIDRTLREKIGTQSWEEKFWSHIATLPAVRSFAVDLPPVSDYQMHRAEVRIDALPAGEYAILASATSSFSTQKNTLALQYIYVSDIAYVGKGNGFYVVNRNSGAPLPGAKVQLWREKYDYTAQKRLLEKASMHVADSNGYFTTGKNTSAGNSQYFLEITHRNERLFINEPVYAYEYHGSPAPEKARQRTFLFTDRSIYRPGQIVYFKGIVVNEKNIPNTATAATSRKGMIRLLDANGETVDSLEVTTNEYGSYSGRFTLPRGILNGSFSLVDTGSSSRVNFNVEEYKRPRFAVELSKPAGTYRANDTIAIGGTAKAYAGNNITGATVNYRVVRRAVIPLWSERSFLPRIWPPYPRQEMEIANGTTVTDSEGRFIIHFRALPDKSISKEYAPVFHYEVSADITDLTGETRSGSASVSVGYHALQMQFNIPPVTDRDSIRSIGISTTNMNEVFERTMVNIAIHELRAPGRHFRERYWEQPDQFVMSRDEYYRHFPHDLYANENDMTGWPKEKTVFTVNTVTAPDALIMVNAKAWNPGWYLAEAMATDKNGDTIRTRSYFRIDDNEIHSPFITARIRMDAFEAQPGDRVQYRLLTNADSITVLHELVNNTGETREFLAPGAHSTPRLLTPGEADRGEIVVNMFFVRHNRIYTQQSSLSVPFRNKQLRIDFTSFRDKTLPGAQEKWKMKISGRNGEKLAAEVLTAMYDASLDAFRPHRWRPPHLWGGYVSRQNWSAINNFETQESQDRSFGPPQKDVKPRIYDRLLGMQEGYNMALEGRVMGVNMDLAKSVRRSENGVAEAAPPAPAGNREMAQDESAAYNAEAQTETPPPPGPSVQIRKNLEETAFFFPQLSTDPDGNIEISFTTPESLTQWKWMILAHTKNLAFAYDEKTMITQKQLMVQPNLPRFFREGDIIDLAARIANMTSRELTGTATLQLIDPATGEPVNGEFQNIAPQQFFTAAPGQSSTVRFHITVPFNFKKPVQWQIVATTGMPGSNDTARETSLSDGEQSIVPVISNRLLVTETITLPMKGVGSRNFRFEKLLGSAGSRSLQHHAVTVEFTSNPAWYAVQALPYLTEQKHENAEQVFNRYFANALASEIANSAPEVRQIIEKWKHSDTSAFLSNLQKNEELKAVLLRETPWVLEAGTEAAQKRNIALLFDMTRMQADLDASLQKLASMQAPTGGFVWNTGGREDRFMTQYIISGIGHLRHLGALPESQAMNTLIRKGVTFLDNELKREYDLLKKANKTLPVSYTGNLPVQYLYMRSFFPDIAVPGEVFTAYHYFRKQSKKEWLTYNSYMRGMIALSLQRTGDKLNAGKIMAALKETAIHHEELGMYWKDMTGGYYWHQAPIESQALLIEAFSEILHDDESVNDMKTWLLKNKQTNNWKTSKATADACYALLLQGSEWLASQPNVVIKAGNMVIRGDADAEAGTGYFKRRIEENINPAMGNITVTVGKSDQTSSSLPSWGGVYWQYFEDLDKITPAETPLKLNKQLFVQTNTDRGPVLKPLADNHSLAVGDKVIVRVELRVDRDMEYVHMKDMRGSCFEPVNVLSGYRWTGGLGYYEATRDVSTDFFFDRLPKGTHVFEYPVFTTQTGSFSNGITTIQCMYAPEFSSHSEGIKLNVEAGQ